MKLAVNIDHVATLRQARGENQPDPVIAAGICELAGAEGIVCHLREDRRHINDRDLKLLREIVKTKLDLEMAATDEMINIAIKTKPDMVTLVPENRKEITTEGGLNIQENKKRLKEAISKLHSKNIPVSLFIDPILANIDASVEINADIIEIHTGNYANSKSEQEKIAEISKIAVTARMASELGLIVTAGHGLNYQNVSALKNIPEIKEISIGHAIISRAVFTGLHKAVEDMIKIIDS